MGVKGNAYEALVTIPKGSRHFEDVAAGSTVILKWILRV
jgi:hypothetical protein